MEPKDLSTKELKKFKKNQEELYKTQKDILDRGKTSIVLSMIDKELLSRGER